MRHGHALHRLRRAGPRRRPAPRRPTGLTGLRRPGALRHHGRVADHPRIVAVKDCSYDLLGTQKVLSRTGLACYAGCDEQVLALYALGAAGCVSAVANVVPDLFRSVLDAFDAGDTQRAALLQRQAVRLIERMTAAGLPGTVTAKDLLGAMGLPAGPVRAPLRPAAPGTTATLLAAYEELTAATGRSRA